MRGPIPAARRRRVDADAADADVRRGRATGIQDQGASLLQESFPHLEMMTLSIVLVPVELVVPVEAMMPIYISPLDRHACQLCCRSRSRVPR